MKVQPSVKKICDKCKVIRRHGRVMVIWARTCATSSARAEDTTSQHDSRSSWTRDRKHDSSTRPGRGDRHGRTPRPGRHPRHGGWGPEHVPERCCCRPPQRSGEPHKMARLVGVDLPREKRVEIALTYIFGVGRTRAKQALEATGVNPDTRVRDLGDEELVKLRDYIDGNVKVEGDLRREVAPTSAARSRSAATRVCGTAAVCRCAVSAPRPTRAPARAPSAPWPARRRPAGRSRSSSTCLRAAPDTIVIRFRTSRTTSRFHCQ